MAIHAGSVEELLSPGGVRGLDRVQDADELDTKKGARNPPDVRLKPRDRPGDFLGNGCIDLDQSGLTPCTMLYTRPPAPYLLDAFLADRVERAGPHPHGM
jgi:hypothetical protein